MQRAAEMTEIAGDLSAAAIECWLSYNRLYVTRHIKQMARYPAEHKIHTRARILEAARYEFRRRGFDATSIDHVMKRAGLTRGGFYAHFASKEALVAEVLAIEPGLVREVRQLGEMSRASTASQSNGVSEVFARYLDPRQRAGLIDCPFVAHAMDSARTGSDRQQAYTTWLHELLAALERARVDRGLAVEAATLAIGAAVLNATIPDGKLAHEIADVASQRIARLVATPIQDSEPR